MATNVAFALLLTPGVLGLAQPRTAAKSKLVAALGGGVRDPVLASPLTGEALLRDRRVYGRSVELAYREADGSRIYRDNGVYVDLTPSSASAPEFSFEELATSLWSAAQAFVDQDEFGQQLFRNPAVSFLYERGWRQQFNANGFPGIDKEFEEVERFFAPVARDQTVLDMSCGSGLMTRRLVASGEYKRVIGADYSESMLAETATRFRSSRLRLPDLVRCDVSALPFQTGSLSAVHAGAALHCWPDAEGGLREIARALKPGGALFATTFLTSALIGTRRVDATSGARTGAGFRVFELEELRGMLRAAGFDEATIDVRQEGRACAVCKARTPQASA
jgi:ubiquinone/menaquinone biosynthesis C-methylase UbiE